MLFAFQGIGRGGAAVSGSIDAAGQKEARAKLRAEGIFVTTIAEEIAAHKKKYAIPFLAARVTGKQMTSFMRQVSSLLTAGIPLMETLEATMKQSESPHFSKIIHEVKDRVRQGEPLAEALAKTSADFDPLSVALVRAGETGGNLAEVLTQVADLKEAALRREGIIKSAMVYPVILGFIGMGVVMFLLGYVVPKITVIFEDMGQALPLPTKILLFITHVITGYGFIIGALLIAGAVWLGRRLKTENGRDQRDRLFLSLPVLGNVTKAAVLARWSHTTSVLLSAGVPMLKTLKLSAEVSQNTVYARAIEVASDKIREGAGIAASLDESGLFPPVAIQMIAAGEKSGQAAKLLMQVARDQGAELENRISVLMSLVQPALIIFLGSIVGFIVVSILLPIFDISQKLG